MEQYSPHEGKASFAAREEILMTKWGFDSWNDLGVEEDSEESDEWVVTVVFVLPFKSMVGDICLFNEEFLGEIRGDRGDFIPEDCLEKLFEGDAVGEVKGLFRVFACLR